MPYIGRYTQGGQCPLTLACVDVNGTPSLPAAAPTVQVRSDSGFIQAITLPILDRYGATGLFQYSLPLGSSYPSGRYRVTYHWTVGSFVGTTEDNFEVAAGGDAAGAIIAAQWYERPHANFLVLQTDTGTLLFGRNPGL
jgi:hypothetical protein